MDTPDYLREVGHGEETRPPSSAASPAIRAQSVPKRKLIASREAGPTLPGSSRGWPSADSRVFFAGFGLSLILLTIEFLTAGAFPGWLILVPTNPTTILAALLGHQVEAATGAGWSDQAYFGTLAAESALWWYAVAVFVTAARRRRTHKC